MPPTSMQHQQRTNSQSSLAKLKHWFNKGSELPVDNKASQQAKRKQQQRDNGSARYVAGQNLHTADGAAPRPYLISPRGPRLSPQAVQVEASNSSSEGDNVSKFSSLRSSPPSSLNSAQSHLPLEQSKRPQPRNPKPGALPISLPQPRQSLIDFAAKYVDVQNPARANPANKKSPPVADPKSPRKQNEQRPKEFRPDHPVKEVKQGRAAIVTPPTHQRSQKTVVRKMVPPPAPATDNHTRQVYRRETRFEDFMGKDSPPPMPPMPPLPALAAPTTAAHHRLSRPFAAAVPVEQSVNEDVRPGTASTAALSVTDSRAQTWLRYDRRHGDSAQFSSTDSPLFPLRIPTPAKYTPCQSCQTEVHPSTAFSYNGTYLCEDCAATGRWSVGDKKKESLKVKKNKVVSRKPVAKTSIPSFIKEREKQQPTGSTLSTSSTLLGNLSFSSRPRRTDVPPGTEYRNLESANPSSPAPPSSSTSTSSPRSPYFATPNAEGKYPRYRTPPPPPIVTTSFEQHAAEEDEKRLPTPPPDSPLRKPKPASSIYPSTPWRMSRPPSIPAVPERYLVQETGTEMGKEKEMEKRRYRDTIYRAEVEEDIIDSYAIDSPVSPMSEPGGGHDSVGEYVNAGWRTRRNVF
ncbi:MAG: hypothetical protein Q9168_005326 [Polycauliona sp. 1 TL-2023]